MLRSFSQVGGPLNFPDAWHRLGAGALNFRAALDLQMLVLPQRYAGSVGRGCHQMNSHFWVVDRTVPGAVLDLFFRDESHIVSSTFPVCPLMHGALWRRQHLMNMKVAGDSGVDGRDNPAPPPGGSRPSILCGRVKQRYLWRTRRRALCLYAYIMSQAHRIAGLAG